MTKHFISLKKYFISLTKYFISSKKHSISLTKHFISWEKYFISLTKYFISSKKHSISLKQSFISLTKYSISLTKQRSLINNSTHFQFSRSHSSKKTSSESKSIQIRVSIGAFMPVLGLLFQNFFANLIEFFKRANLRDETKHLLAGQNLFKPITIEQYEALSYCL